MKLNAFASLALFALAACGQGGGASLPPTQSATAARQATSSGYSYTVANLGTLGGSVSGATSINNAGWISGLSTLPSGSYLNAALWRDGSAPVDLGTLGGPNSAVEWPVKNDHGLVSGISETGAAQKLGEIWSCALAFFPQPPSGHICRGFAWEDGRMKALPTLGGNNGFAAGANDAGEIVGWAETRKHDSTCVSPQVLGFQAVVYTPWRRQKIRALRPYRGDKDSAATEINDRGQVVGISGICDQAVGRFTAKHAVMWDDGRTIDLGNLGGVAWNTPMAINRHGVVVGFADLPGDTSGTPNPVAFIWTRQHGMQSLGTLPGDTNSEAYGINDEGVVVGQSFSASSSRAFVWAHGKMTDLNSLVPPSAQLYLIYANDVNDDGVIVGGACVLVSGACGSEAPAYAATPTGRQATALRARPVPEIRLPQRLLAGFGRRPLVP